MRSNKGISDLWTLHVISFDSMIRSIND
jgi:hypothetical protein